MRVRSFAARWINFSCSLTEWSAPRKHAGGCTSYVIEGHCTGGTQLNHIASAHEVSFDMFVPHGIEHDRNKPTDGSYVRGPVHRMSFRPRMHAR